MSSNIERQRQARLKRLVYVDLAPSVGGSIISLYQLVRGLDRSRYAAHVLLAAGNPFVERFRALGVPVMLIGAGPQGAMPSGSSGAAPASRVARLRASGLARWLKRSAIGERMVHLVGFYLRTYPDLRRQAQRLYDVFAAIRPDLVHLNDVVCVSRAGIMAARRAGVPAICHLRAMAWRNHFDRALSRYLRGYICISQAVDAHQRRLGGRVDPSWIVYNGLDPAEFDDLPAPQAVRWELGFEAGDQVVGCIGRLVAWKGQAVLLEAMALLADRYPRLCALMVGAPEAGGEAYAEELRSLAKRLGIEQRVLFTGFRLDALRLLRAMDVLVHTSTAPEPFGRVLIEGMAAGVPVIAAAAGAVPEIIRDGVDGRTVPPGDARALAEAIGQVLSQPLAAAGWVAAARQTVLTRFTTDSYVRGVQRVYEEILA